MGRNLITNRALRHLVGHYKQISKSPETLVWYLGVESTGTRSKPISGASARERKNFLAKSFITSGSPKCSDANNEKYKRNNLYFVLSYNMSFKRRLNIYLVWIYDFLTSGNRRRYSRSSTHPYFCS